MDAEPAAVRAARLHLESAALGYAAMVGALGADDHDAIAGAVEYLGTTALAFAASSGSLDAAERAELHALRRFRDGIASLRAELATADPTGHVLAIETIDAFFALSYPKIDTATTG